MTVLKRRKQVFQKPIYAFFLFQYFTAGVVIFIVTKNYIL